MNIAKLLGIISKAGINLSIENGEVKVTATKGAMTQEIKQLLVANKADIVKHLQALSTNQTLSLPPLTKRGQNNDLPLSFSQQRLWFVEQLEQGSSQFNSVVSIKLTGEWKPAAFERAVKALFARHEVLRTHFVEVNKEPKQRIANDYNPSIQHLDLSSVAEPERQPQLVAIAKEAARQPFDLSQDLMLRVIVVQLTPDEQCVILTTHHIASDGWSKNVLKNDLTALYHAEKAGLSSPLPALDIQYADFAQWQRNWLQGDVLDLQLDYWQSQLKDIPVLHSLPIDGSRKPEQVGKAQYHQTHIASEVSSRIKLLSKQQDVTLFMFMHAAFSILLSRFSNENDIVTGTAIAGRFTKELEPLIGFFVNDLVLRAKIDKDQNFSEFLANHKRTVLDAYQYQYVPFDTLVETLNPSRSLSHNPLFQIKMDLHNHNSASEAVQEQQEDAAIDHVTSEDLYLSIGDSTEGLTLTWMYNAELFNPETIDSMASSFAVLVESICADIHTKIGKLETMSTEDRTKLLELGAINQQPEQAHSYIQQLIEQQAVENPTANAVTFEQESISYQELNERANRLAHYLIASGVKPDTLVGICIERSIDMFIGIVAILKAGGAYVPMDPSYPESRLAYILEDCDFEIILSEQDIIAEMDFGGRKTIPLDGGMAELLAANFDSGNPDPAALGLETNNTAYAIYTSGSTGEPRAVLVSHQNLIASTAARNVAYSSTPSNFLLLSSYAFDSSVAGIFWTLTTGGNLVVAETTDGLECSKFLGLVEKNQISHILTLPSVYANILTYPMAGQNPVQQVIVAGEVCPESLTKTHYADDNWQQVQLVNEYGPTEGSVWASYYDCVDYIEQGRSGSVSIGHNAPHVALYVLDEQMQLAPTGVTGELYIGGPGVARGYLNQPQLTEQRFLPNPFVPESNARLYKTGDLVRWDQQGALEYIGRQDGQIKIRGYRVELSEIEAALLRLDNVHASAVSVANLQDGEPRLVAYVKLSESLSESAYREYRGQDELDLNLEQMQSALFLSYKSQLQQQLPDYMIPSIFMVMDQLPLLPNGKVDKKMLPEPQESDVHSEVYVAPTTQTQKTLCELWQQVLKLEQVGIHDNFFMLGGHSLLGTKVISLVRETLKVEVPLKALFEAPTVAELSEYIDTSCTASNIPDIQVADRSQPMLLSYAQQRLWFIDKLGGGSPQYNVPKGYYIDGAFNLNAFKAALTALIDRHESIRTNFVATHGEARQVIREEFTLPLVLHDLSKLAPELSKQKLDDIIRKEAKAVFDLATDLLLRVRIVKLSKTSHVILYTMHHIASDGWSSSIVQNELNALYQAFCHGEANPLPPMPLQYLDYAMWQRQWLQGETLDAQLTYWQEQLAGVPATHRVPLDKPRPQTQSFEGQFLSHRIDGRRTSAIHALCSQHQVTLFMFLETAFAVLLGKYSNESDIVIGAPIAGRSHEALNGLIGFFVNSLALRADLSGNPTFSELLQRNKQVILDAYAHQHIPFELIVEKLRPERQLNHNPLFQITFAVQNNEQGHMDSQAEPPVEASDALPESLKPNIRNDLELHVIESNGELIVYWLYNDDLFTEESIKRMSASYDQLLGEILESLSGAKDITPISQLSVVNEAQHQAKLTEALTRQEQELKAECWHQLFAQQAATTPNATAVSYDGEEWSYEQVNKRANKLARYLIELGADKGSMIPLCMDRSVEMIVALLATLKAGAAYVPLDPLMPADRIKHICDDCDAKILLTSSTVNACASNDAISRVVLGTQSVEAALVKHAGEELGPLVPVSPTDLAYVLYTSGSTGMPKGVMVEHQNLFNLACNMRHWVTQNCGEQASVWALNAGLSFDASLQGISQMAFGMELVILPQTLRMDAQALQQYLSSQRLDVFDCTPSQLRVLLEQGDSQGFPALVVGGEKIGEQLWSELVQLKTHHDIASVNVYGPTEACVNTTWCNIDEATPYEALGEFLANVYGYVVAPQQATMSLVPDGVVGELIIGGAGVARGYLNRKQLTRETFVDDPFNPTLGKVYRTGDLVRTNAEGKLEFVGRVDDQVKIRGYRIELGEIEAKLNAHKDVAAAAVTLNHKDPENPLLTGYVSPTQEFLRRYSQESNSKDLALWSEVFEEQYDEAQEVAVAESNFVGWNSSYTGEPLAIEQMQEWRDGTIEQILSLKPKHLLEVGCGTGLLLFAYAPHCDSVHATELSFGAMNAVQQELDKRQWQHVELTQGDALNMSAIAGKEFDTIVINSVAQYFPNPQYLEQVIENLLPHLAEGGKLFLGDIRNLDIYHAHLAMVEQCHLTKSISVDEFNSRIQRRIQQEPELLISPSFFKSLEANHSSIGKVDIVAKRGVGNNEMLRYRYEAILTKGPQVQQDSPIQWHAFDSLESIKALLEDGRSASFGVSGVPNQRLTTDMALMQGLAEWKGAKLIHPQQGADQFSTCTQSKLVQLEQLLSFAQDLGYQANLTWSQDDVASLDLVFSKDNTAKIEAKAPYRASELLNYPRLDVVGLKLTDRLNAALAEVLPAYMLPTSYTALPQLPLTASGKVNKRVLPQPVSNGVSHDELVAPSNEVETKLCAIWQTLLHVEQVGVTDNFFSLGGHSLLATRLVSAVRAAFNKELTLAEIFAKPTIAEIAPALADVAEQEVLPQIHKVDRNRPIPLSFAQQRLWFIDKLNKGSLEYVMSGCFAISGELDEQAFEHALQALIERHEILRTCYRTIAGEPSQVVETSFSLPYSLVDVSELDELAKQQRIQQLLDVEANTPFNLDTDVMLRVVLVKMAADAYLVIHSTHHIASDGWSMGLFKQELTQLYVDFMQGQSSSLAPLSLQYADYSVWQRQWLKQSVLEKELAYWRKQLAKLPVLHSLALDQARPAQASYQGQLVEQPLEPQLSQDIKAMAAKQDVTQFMFLESAFALLLGRLSQSNDVVFGSPISGRVHKDVENLIGFFVNTLVLRHDLSGETTFSDLLKRNKQMLLDAYSNQHIPFEMLVEKLSPERLRNANPLFQVVFALQNQSQASFGLEDLSQDEQSLGLANIDSQRSTRFDLELNVIESESGFNLHWTYNTALFEAETISTWSNCFAQLLATLCASLADKAELELPISQLEFGLVEPATMAQKANVASNLDDRLLERCQALQSLLAKHPAVREVAVLVDEQSETQEDLVAFWQRDERVDCERSDEEVAKDLLKFVRIQPVLHTMPKELVLLPSLPRNYQDQIDVLSLREMLEQSKEVDNYVAPTTEMETKLCHLWQSILEQDKVGVEDNFFAIGGHSLLATRITSAIKETIGVELPISILFESPTVALLAKDIESRMNEVVLPPITLCDRNQAILPSYSQQRLWFIDQLGADSVQYNVSGRLLMPLDLNLDAFKLALQGLIARHEVLRTNFALVDGEPQQIIHDSFDLPYTEIDLIDLNLTADADKVAMMANEEATTPFDLSQDLMFRVRVIKLAHDACIVLYTMHHIASDGWSIAILNDEIQALYQAALANETAALPALRVQFADYAMWQRQWLTGDLLEKQLGYWQQQLKGAPMVHGLVLDKPRPAQQSYAGHKFTQIFDKPMTQQIKALCEQHEVTMFMFMETVFAVLLTRFGQNKDILIGSPMSGRNNKDLEPLIGFFVNSLVLRTDVTDNPTFSELLQTNKRTILQGYAHQHTPFDMLVERVRPERNQNFNPVYQISFTAQVGKRNLLEFQPELESSTDAFEIKKTSIRFDLMLNVKEVGEEMTLGWSYNAAIFNDDTVFSMASSMRVLMEGIFASLAKDPWEQEGVAELPLVPSTADTANQGEQEANLTAAPLCLHQMFESQVAANENRSALRFEGQELSYQQLNAKANQLAHQLIEHGVKPNTIVGLYMPQSIEVMVAMLAVLKAGGAYLHIDPAYPAERCRFMLQDCATQLVLTHADSVQAWNSISAGRQSSVDQLQVDLAAFDTKLSGYDTRNVSDTLASSSAEDLAYVIYTSGSTGRPKAVMVQHQAIVDYCQQALPIFYQPNLCGSLLTSSLGFDATIVSAMFPLLQGGVVDIWHNQGDWSQFWQALVESQQDTLVKITPSHIQALDTLAASIGQSAARHSFVVGGEVFSAQALNTLKQAFPHARIFNQYGPTEAVVGSTYKDLTWLTANAETPITIGQPFANKTAYVLNPQGALCPVGAVGTLFIGGSALAQGYLHNESLSNQRFVADPYANEPNAVMYNTGDLVRLRADGEFEFIGRVDCQVKVRGYRIELGEIESVIVKHQAVQSCLVNLNPADGRLVAYVIAQPEWNNDESDNLAKELRDYLALCLPEYMLPSAWVELNAFPLNVNGKVDKSMLPCPSADDLARDEYVSAVSDSEALLISIWADLLDIEQDTIGSKDNFFALGGHSLLIMRMLAKLQEHDIHLQVSDVIAAADLGALAKVLDEEHQENTFVLPDNLIPPGCKRITREMLPLIELTQAEIDNIVSTVDGGCPRVQDIYPLVSLQEGIYFHHILEPSNDPYLESKKLLMDSRDQVDMLLSGLQLLIDRHDIYRTAIVSKGMSQPVQVVYRDAVLPVETFQLDATLDVEAQLQDKLANCEPMDLSIAPMIRVKVAQDPHSDKWYFILQYHHLISDHESSVIMAAELSAFASGNKDSLAPSVPYRNFVAHTLHLNDEEKAREYFTSVLADVTEPTLPCDLDNVYGGGREVDIVRQTVDAALSKKIRATAKALQISPAVLFHTAWAWVVGAFSAKHDVVFGTVLSGRMQSAQGIEGALGMFINTLPLRVQLDKGSVKDVVLATDQSLKELLSFEQTPLSLAQQCSNIEQGTPLFSAIFNYRHGGKSKAQGNGDNRSGVRTLSAEDRTNYPFALSVNDMLDDFVFDAQIDHRTSGARVVSYMEHALTVLVERLQAESSLPLCNMSLLPEGDCANQIIEWNQDASDFVASGTIHGVFEQQVARHPDAVALIFGDTEVSYRELNAQANKLANYLVAAGVGLESRVGICQSRSVSMIVSVLATLKAGGCYVPIDPQLPAQRLQFIVEESNCKLLLSQADLQTKLESLVDCDVLPLDDSQTIAKLAACSEQAVAPLASACNLDNLAYSIYTSGSTGTPKGVLLNHRGLINLIHSQQALFDVSDNSRVLQFASFSFDAATWEIFMALGNGATLCLLSDEQAKSTEQLTAFVNKVGVTHATLPPAILPSLDSTQFNSVTKLIVAGEAVSEQLAQEWSTGRALFNAYGPTETTVCATVSQYQGGRLAIGRSLQNLGCYVLNEYLQPVPVGVAGNLYVSGVALARGYYKQAGQSADRFVPDPFATEPGARMYHTGDVVRWNQTGEMEFIGRTDDQIKIRGYRVELGGVANVLLDIPEVDNAFVCSQKLDNGSDQLVAYIVASLAEETQTAKVDHLKPRLEQRLPNYMVPKIYIFVDDIPLNSNGKVDRKALPAVSGEHLYRAEYVAPRNETERVLCQMWSALLDVERIGIHDDFYALGGHSLVATRLLSAIRHEFNVEFPMKVLLETPTIAQLSEQLLSGEFAVAAMGIGDDDITPDSDIEEIEF